MNGWVLWNVGLFLLNAGFLFCDIVFDDVSGVTVFSMAACALSLLGASLSWRTKP